jgi:outer membrane immunogenic protein
MLCPKNLRGFSMKRLACAAAALTALGTVPAAAADLAAAPAYKAASPVMPILYNWTGFYIGGHVTGAWTHSDSITVDTTTGLPLGSASANRSSVHGGGQIGYDYMFSNRVVLGIVADAQSGTSNSTLTVNPAGTIVQTTRGTTDATGTVRGRLGYAIDALLLYGTGGWAWSTGSSTRTQLVGTTGLATPGIVERASVNINGWTGGGGLAWAFARNWDVFTEYRYTRFSNYAVTFPIAQRASTLSSSANAIEAGVDYRF